MYMHISTCILYINMYMHIIDIVDIYVCTLYVYKLILCMAFSNLKPLQFYTNLVKYTHVNYTIYYKYKTQVCQISAKYVYLYVCIVHTFK